MLTEKEKAKAHRKLELIALGTAKARATANKIKTAKKIVDDVKPVVVKKPSKKPHERMLPSAKPYKTKPDYEIKK